MGWDDGKKKKARSLDAVERDVWNHCRRIVRERAYAKDGDLYCYTCGAGPLVGSNAHTGHMVNAAVLGWGMRYDLRILRVQCYRCNIHLGGNGAVYLWRWLAENGIDAAQKLFEDIAADDRDREYLRYYLDELAVR